ncbi:MAG: exodeoxyribonuclease VII small subunit [Patescibacteria group bacterium]
MVKEKENLQSALEQLEKIVEELGFKDVDVEAGLAKFKQGVELVRLCRAYLRKAENEFEKLKKELEVDTGEGEEEEESKSAGIPF